MEQEPEAHDQDGIVMQPLAAAPWVTTAPAGVRFVPTEFELVDQYLANKFLNFQVPPDTIRELDVYAYHPDELPGLAHNTRSDQVLYFFTPLKRLGGGNVNADRKARNGSWELTQTYRGLYKTSAYENGVIRRHLKFIGNEGFECNFLMKEYVMDVTRTNAADPVIALCIIHPPRAGNQWHSASSSSPFIYIYIF